MNKYILDNKIPILIDSIIEWAIWFEEATRTKERLVGQIEIKGMTISSVFLGIDVLMTSNPYLFETIIVHNKIIIYQTKQKTWEEALEEFNSLVKIYEKYE